MKEAAAVEETCNGTDAARYRISVPSRILGGPLILEKMG
jgi:hypothetical protein